VDWAAYYGVQIEEADFFERLPVSENPDKGFVGDVNGAWGQTPPGPYGVYAEPVAWVLRAYGLPAQAVRPFSWDGLRAEIASGRPVIVWVTGHVQRGTPVAYLAPDEQEITVARFEHTVIVIGYDEHHVKVLDGAKVYTRTLGEFMDSWGVLNYMALIYQP
jgi:uncharacterized protein YvpB